MHSVHILHFFAHLSSVVAGQGPWLKAEELQGAAVQGAGGSRPSSRSPAGSLQQQQPLPTPARGLLGLRSGSFRRAARSTKAAARKLSEASECGAALGIPKVALLFLTPGDMPLEQVRHRASSTACPPHACCHIDTVAVCSLAFIQAA